MMAPSNSVPLPVLIVVGENAFQMMVSQMFVAMNREIPDPRPYLYSITKNKFVKVFGNISVNTTSFTYNVDQARPYLYASHKTFSSKFSALPVAAITHHS